MGTLDPELLSDIEEFSVLEDQQVFLIRGSPTRIATNCANPELPDLLSWACAIGEGVRFSFGNSPREAWAGALARHQDGT